MAVTVIAAEICLRIAFPQGNFIWKPYMSRVFHPARGMMPRISGESTFQTNSRGLRADEIAATHDYRILTIGGSTTECLYLDQDKAWPQLLQDALNSVPNAPRTWVGTAGSGRNSRHHLMAMRHLPFDEMKIDTVALLVAVNDLFGENIGSRRRTSFIHCLTLRQRSMSTREMSGGWPHLRERSRCA